MKKVFRNNGLSIVLVVIFIICLAGQIITGFKEHNNELKEDGGKPIEFNQYFTSGHFIESTFENWESEFLQMGMYVVLAAFLFQKGSSESNDPDNPEPPESITAVKKRFPKLSKNGFLLILYSYSLSIAFFILFILSFILHWYGSMKDYNQEQSLKGEPLESAFTYLTNNRFWFESFQNWQSEFLAVLAVVTLTIFLRHKGSSQSKKLADPDSKTGE